MSKVCSVTVSSESLTLFSKDAAVQTEFHRGRVIHACVILSAQVSGVPEEQLLVFLYPGLPSTAELFILPDENTSNEHKKSSEEAVETVRGNNKSNSNKCLNSNKMSDLEINCIIRWKKCLLVPAKSCTINLSIPSIDFGL